MKSNKIVFLLLVLAILLRFGFIFGTHAFVHPETVEGGVIAHAIVTGQGFSMSSPHRSDYFPSAIQAPVFPILLAGFYYLFGENDNAHLVLMLFQSALSVWLCYLIYQLGRIIFDEKTGLIAMAIAVFYPIFIIYSGRALNTMTSIFTVTFFFYLLLKYTYAKKPDIPLSYKNSVYLGISAGIAVLSEPGMVGFLVLFALFYLLFFFLKYSRKINIQIPGFKFLFITGIVDQMSF